jgi:alkanesulfonate monooxygenase SsuD/methylene tetrahydromethanopterin reductase-like flavin-dependent oxidoreductase (luciferase family)
MTHPPLAVLDLVPRSTGASIAEGVRNALDLAQRTEQLGYDRYWLAEHHLNPGVLGAAPALSIALIAGATSTIRLGSAGVQTGNRTPLSIVEEFGLLDALYPGRLDLGIGRSFSRPAPTAQPTAPIDGAARELVSAAVSNYQHRAGQADHTAEQRAANGLLLPKKFDFAQLASRDRLGLHFELLQQPGAYADSYDRIIESILGLLRGTFRSTDGYEAHAYPGEGAAVQVWILGASGGESAAVAGQNSLRFAASYHHSPSTVLDAVDAYRAAFRPSAELATPYISVSADVVVGEDDRAAQRLASGYGLWVRSIRRGSGAIPYPTPEESAAHVWSDEDRDLVKDRVDTQLVGSPTTVADQLEQLQQATGADELAITTITHRHEDRVRSYQLLAEEWQRRAASSTNRLG